MNKAEQAYSASEAEMLASVGNKTFSLLTILVETNVKGCNRVVEKDATKNGLQKWRTGAASNRNQQAA
jgi:hypothetical protein